MGYECPVCATEEADGEHLANHLALQALVHGDAVDRAGKAPALELCWGEKRRARIGADKRPHAATRKGRSKARSR